MSLHANVYRLLLDCQRFQSEQPSAVTHAQINSPKYISSVQLQSADAYSEPLRVLFKTRSLCPS